LRAIFMALAAYAAPFLRLWEVQLKTGGGPWLTAL
jgi:hypothetical protein